MSLADIVSKVRNHFNVNPRISSISSTNTICSTCASLDLEHSRAKAEEYRVVRERFDPTGSWEKLYAENHRHSDPDPASFPLVLLQLENVNAYLRSHPDDVPKRVYYAHLLSELGADTLALDQCKNVLATTPSDPFMIYSVSVVLDRWHQGTMRIDFPKVQWGLAHRYGVIDENDGVKARDATYGEVEFLRAQMGEQDC